ncbi:GAF domain-containing protein [Nocardia alni]|uniref:GAF domain-containing protein n=1 Tax=Nocardia alni TaxID=2815723 RepID=UPI001C21139C|nr:GAF domain-containing protein [Nocardia alni]
MTIETLAPGALSVASVGETAREFAGWQRVAQRLLARTPALYDSLTTSLITEAVLGVRDRAQELEQSVPTTAGPHLLRIRPVFGPAGDVHAVRVWLGPADGPKPEPAPAVGAVWDLDTQTVALPGGITSLCGISAEEYVPGMSIAELFARMTAFDRHAELLDLLYDPKPGDKLQFEVTMPGLTGNPGRWRITIRARTDTRPRGAWWLIEDISSTSMPVAWPTLERVGLREAHRRAGTHLAVVQLEHTSISHWLTDPAPWIRWDYLFRPVEAFHPDDRDRLAELGGNLRSGGTAGVVVRALNYNGGYTPTSLLMYPYPGYSARQLAIAQLVRVPDIPLLEPEPSLLDVPGGHAPIGYDDQLRHWLSRRLERRVDY